MGESATVGEELAEGVDGWARELSGDYGRSAGGGLAGDAGEDGLRAAFGAQPPVQGADGAGQKTISEWQVA